MKDNVVIEAKLLEMVNTSDGHNKYYNILAVQILGEDGLANCAVAFQNWGSLSARGNGYGKSFIVTTPQESQNLMRKEFALKSTKKIGEGYREVNRETFKFDGGEKFMDWFAPTSFFKVADPDVLKGLVGLVMLVGSEPNSVEPEVQMVKMKHGILLEHNTECEMRGSW